MAIMIPRAQRRAAKQEIGKLNTKLSGITDPNRQRRINTRISYLQNRNGIKAPVTPAATTPGPDPVPAPAATTPAPTTPPPAQAAPAQQPQQFRSVYDFMPKDVTNTPMYNYRLSEGRKALDRQLAAQGLSGSGNAIERDVGLANQLTAEETARSLSTAIGEAGRYDTQNENSAMRGERQGNENFNRLYQLLDLAARQNPMEYAYQGTGEYANTVENQGKMNSAQTRDAYGRVSSGGGGGNPIYAPPFPGAPDYTQAELYKAGARTQNRDDLFSSITSALPKILGMF